MSSCQKCRQPLSLDDSIAALSPSAYDMISANHHPTRARQSYVPVPSRYTSTRPSLPPIHISPHPPSGLGPGDSFVVLTESVVRPARADSIGRAGSQSGGALAALASSSEDERSTTPLTPRLAQLSALYGLLSSNTPVDHPLCTECMEALLGLMRAELDEGKRERDRLLGFEKEVMRKRTEESVGREGLAREIAKLKKVEKLAVEEMNSVEKEREGLDREKEELEREEAILVEEEEEFWRQHSKYLLAAATLRDRTASLQTRYAHDVRELDKLQRTNVYNDAFCIGQEAGFGTINGLRLGRLPETPVEWPEINAAWGHTLLLLQTIARKFNFTFETYKLLPLGSFSRIEKKTGDKAIYELYGSGDFAVTRLLQNRRFDLAMVSFLDCLRQLLEFVEKTQGGRVRIPHAVVKDKIGDVSIKLQFGSDEAWTRALRHVLLDLKILLGRASL